MHMLNFKLIPFIDAREVCKECEGVAAADVTQCRPGYPAATEDTYVTHTDVPTMAHERTH